MTIKTVLIDTNLLKFARSYHLAKTQPNDTYLSLLPKAAKLVYEAIETQAVDNIFYISDMSVVEMKGIHIKNSIYEFARHVYKMPIGSLHESAGDIMRHIRREFNKTQISSTTKDFGTLLKSWGGMQKLKILPDALSDTDRMSWRKKQEIIFRTVGDYVNLETQDAYIFASGMAVGVDEIWTRDKPFRAAGDQLRTMHYNKLIRSLDTVLLEDLAVPRVIELKN